MKRIYLDNNATTPLDGEVKESLSLAFDLFANGSSMHEEGRRVKAAIENAREKIALLTGAKAEEILFTGGGSESNNAVLNLIRYERRDGGLGRDGSSPGDRRIISSAVEHPSVLETLEQLEREGYSVTILPVDKFGVVDMDELKAALARGADLVSIMLANNEIGTIQPIEEIAALAREYGIPVHTDGVQGVGKVPVDVKSLGVDYLSCSAHKIYGPKGIGALYVKKGSPFTPFITGGHQEEGKRAGTYNSLGIIGFGKAAERSLDLLDEDAELLTRLRNKLEKGIVESVSDVTVNGHPEKRLPNTVNISFAGAEGESILLYLDMAGIAVSTGSACATGSLDPSHVLMATNMDPEFAHGSIRFSLGRMNTEEEIETVIKVVPDIIEKLRRMSTRYGNTTQQAGEG